MCSALTMVITKPGRKPWENPFGLPKKFDTSQNRLYALLDNRTFGDAGVTAMKQRISVYKK